MAARRPHYVWVAAAKIGGIPASNPFPAEFIRGNLALQPPDRVDALKRRAQAAPYRQLVHLRRLPTKLIREEYLFHRRVEQDQRAVRHPASSGRSSTMGRSSSLGYGSNVSCNELAKLGGEIVDYTGDLALDTSKADGAV